MYRIGIDAGSKTVKIVVMDEDGTIVHSLYTRHKSNIRASLINAVHSLVWSRGELPGTVGITGSAGIGLAEITGLPFYQEVMATTKAVQERIPDADAFIELGGEDAKVVYLTGGLEQRMNATCAGGTGGFIDNIAFALGVKSPDMDSLALGSTRSYPIASRCAVFAESDVRPLLNAGAKAADIAASTLDAVVNQTLGGLACGRPLTGKVVLLGGPLEHILSLQMRFRKALNLPVGQCLKPDDAHLFTACGAAYLAQDGPVLSLGEVERLLQQADTPTDDLPHLPPLFDSKEESKAFLERRSKRKVPRAKLEDARGPLYLGIDAGSTTLKLVLLDEDGNLLHSYFRRINGDVLDTALEALCQMMQKLPVDTQGNPYTYIAHATATGYGENLLRKLLGIDSGTVETMAHLRAAQHYTPNASFVLDIGGQDMKALWLKDGQLTNAVLNEACSSGCGSFLSGSAYSLNVTPIVMGREALLAENPVDLGTKCTVFMSSRVKHAQKIGASREDLCAGIVYSIIRNALFRIVKMDQLDSMGDVIVAQGGTFLNDGVLAAFEKISGKQVIRYDSAQLMGAIGAALTARARAKDIGPDAVSQLVGWTELLVMSPVRTASTCSGCSNACQVTLISSGKRQLVWGAKCSRGEVLMEQADVKKKKSSASAARRASEVAFNRSAVGAKPEVNMTPAKALLCTRGACLHDPDLDDSAQELLKRIRQVQEKDSQVKADAPNVFELERRLLDAFVSQQADSSGGRASSACTIEHRSDITIGLLNTLNMYEQIPFWHTFFLTLGFSVAVPRKRIPAAIINKAQTSIPSESVCLGAKLSHQRLYDLMDQGAHAVFAPQFTRNGKCPVTSGYSQTLESSIPEVRQGALGLIAPEFSSTKVLRLSQQNDDCTALISQLDKLCRTYKLEPISQDELQAALSAATASAKAFFDAMAAANQDALNWIQETNGHGLVLGCRPYHADPQLMHSIDAIANDLGFAVLNGNHLPQAHRPHAPFDWSAGKHLTANAVFVLDNPALDLVCLQSFGCGYDAVSLTEVQAMLEGAGRPFTRLKIDDLVDTAHLRIRLRTLAEAIEAKAQATTDYVDQPAHMTVTLPADEPARQAAAEPARQTAAELMARTTLAEEAAQVAAASHTVDVLGPLSANDTESSLRYVDGDLCYSTALLAGRAIALAKEDASIDALRIPAVCDSCLLDALPMLVQQATDRPIAVEWLKGHDGVQFLQDVYPDAAAAHDECADNLIPIGIVGCPLLAYDPVANGGIGDFIRQQGFQPIWAAPENLLVDDVRYTAQLQAFVDAGITHVIYLQSFGCLKGHVMSRGALHQLKRDFPALSITVLDYDAQASALNRENRIRLVLEAARAAK